MHLWTMLPLGYERSFNALLAKGVHPKIKAVIEARQPESVLEVGAFSGEGLCLLHHWFTSLIHLEGWEAEAEDKVLAAMRKEDAVRIPNARYRTVYERYCMHVAGLQPTLRRPLNTELEYKKVIRLRFKADPAQVVPLLSQYDLLVISNALHRLAAEDLPIVEAKLMALRQDRSLVYIHHKARPLSGYGANNNDTLTRECCERLAAAWNVPRVGGMADHEGIHVTYSDLDPGEGG